jgi:glutamate dehydrogenase/leucine dehydrogenase
LRVSVIPEAIHFGDLEFQALKESSFMKTISPGYGLMSHLSVEQFTRALDSRGGRIAVINRNGELRASLSGFEMLSTELMWHADFADHEAVFFEVSRSTGRLMGAFVHRTRRGPAAGGTRCWSYDSMESFLRDGLRLSKGMTHKNASANLWWGGGKGLIHGVDTLSQDQRARLFREYGRFVSSLRGCYFTAKDVGTSSNDVAEIYRTTRFVTCIPPEYGGSGNPSGATAEGVLRGIEATTEVMGSRLQDMVVGVQGLGEVGSRLTVMLLKAGARVKAFDPDAKRCQDVARLSPRVQVECRSDDAVLACEMDLFAPCALGGILNEQTIPTLQAAAVCGAANNQLASPDRDGLALKRRGILYAPDFIVNRMGIVGCADEPFGWLENDPEVMRHLDKEWPFGVYQMTKKLLADSMTHDSTPHFEAVKLAEAMSLEPHPMRGHRAFQQASQVWRDWSNCDLHRSRS